MSSEPGAGVEPFAEARRRIQHERIRNQSAGVVIVLGCAFVADFFSLGDTPAFQAIQEGVPLQILAGLLTYLVLAYHSIGPRRPLAIGVTAYLVVMGLGGWVLGRLGGLDGPYFYAAYILPAFLVPVPMPLGPRIGITLAMLASFLVPFLGPHPEYLDVPHANIAVNYLVAVTVLDVFVGHRSDQLAAQVHASKVDLDRARRRAEAASERLRTLLVAQARRVRDLADEAEGARTDERAEIARALHDDVGQLLLATRLQLASVEDRIAEAPRSGESLDTLHELLGQLEGRMRGLIVDLREPAGDEATRAGTEHLLGVLRAEGTLEVEVTVPWESLPEELVGMVARFVQEGLNNVLKHAAASRVEVRAVVERGQVRVVVRDDGKGPEGDVGDGWGLLGLRERAEKHGGTVALEARPEGGSQLVLVLPRTEEARRSSAPPQLRDSRS